MPMSSFYDEFLTDSGMGLDKKFPSPGALSEGELTRFEMGLGAMDEQHLAYAITLLGHYSPARLLPHLSGLLSDPRTAVWSAAERALLLLPENELTPARLAEFRAAVEARPGRCGASWAIAQAFARYQKHTA